MYFPQVNSQQSPLEYQSIEQRRQLLQSIGFLTSFNEAVLIKPNEESAVRTMKYLSFLRGIGMIDLAGLMKVSVLPNSIRKSDFEFWDFTRIEKGMNIDVPRTVYDRYALACNYEIPCDGLVLVKQHVIAPKSEIDSFDLMFLLLDPILLYLLTCGEDMAIPCIVGAWKD
jgi:hypothetical protein